MHIRLIAVGDRQPSWVDTAVSDYSARLPRQWRFRIDVVPLAKRSGSADKAKTMEGEKVLARIKSAEQVVILDERGTQLSSRELASKIDDWQSDGRDLTFIIGGPDGHPDAVRERADFNWSLSKLTLPHGMARVVFAEQLYRAWSLTTGHPYHRD